MLSAVIAKYKFTSCGKKHNTGPTQAAADDYYKNTNVKVEILGKGIQKWRVPQSGIYRIDAAGASGSSVLPEYKAGKGSFLSSLFRFSADDVLYILVGQNGNTPRYNWGAPGGGASFVAIKNGTGEFAFNSSIDSGASVSPLIVAAGGGGSGDDHMPEDYVKDGGDGYASYEGEGAGIVGETSSSGSSGFATNGVRGNAKSFLNGGDGGETYAGSESSYGGFGGGGSSWDGGGGGGGFKGGAGGTPIPDFGGTAGFGGYSFQSGFVLKNITGWNSGSGFVTIVLTQDKFATCFHNRHGSYQSTLAYTLLLFSFT